MVFETRLIPLLQEPSSRPKSMFCRVLAIFKFLMNLISLFTILLILFYLLFLILFY